MRHLRWIWAVAAAVTLAPPVAAHCATSFDETFTGGSNDGEWGFGSGGDQLVASGGNPGEFIGTLAFDTFTPRAQTALGALSVFHGDYRAAGVTEMGIDLKTFANQFPNSCMRPISLQLWSDPGTPGNFGDDSYVYFVSSFQAPCAGESWKSYDLDVDAASATLPAGWAVDPTNANPPDQVWNEVIEDVDQVLWWYGDPTFFFIFEQWSVGLDNPRIAFASAPVNYCTAGTSASGCQALMSSSGIPSATSPSAKYSADCVICGTSVNTKMKCRYQTPVWCSRRQRARPSHAALASVEVATIAARSR